jgi:hypothetical protein
MDRCSTLRRSPPRRNLQAQPHDTPWPTEPRDPLDTPQSSPCTVPLSRMSRPRRRGTRACRDGSRSMGTCSTLRTTPQHRSLQAQPRDTPSPTEPRDPLDTLRSSLSTVLRCHSPRRPQRGTRACQGGNHSLGRCLVLRTSPLRRSLQAQPRDTPSPPVLRDPLDTRRSSPCTVPLRRMSRPPRRDTRACQGGNHSLGKCSTLRTSPLRRSLQAQPHDTPSPTEPRDPLDTLRSSPCSVRRGRRRGRRTRGIRTYQDGSRSKGTCSIRRRAPRHHNHPPLQLGIACRSLRRDPKGTPRSFRCTSRRDRIHRAPQDGTLRS